ncbi:two-component system regulatory protein YycI [Aerococcus kribbianus]|uniref:Two-component system regulatory protein YycI n=1 Tax=Aerococcus kribbianus TaxID=2999064 RepID=A0A9X3FMV7_9LACT|nr:MULTISPECIES: two-component system regulatory protein YycI [unclassified Aerococcus]MCZ0717390.1 two-component system regulatory protein YycI [Aerococcus sp. YH-aer221]MCZ0725678.1 two-component system regulatory protein YycI [Aerococcus sp. YH-aer222]
MAFRKIEYLLILAFLTLNIFLFYVFVGKNALLFSDPIDQNRVNVQEEMRSDNIEFSPPEETDEYEPFMRAIPHAIEESDVEDLANNHYDFELSSNGRVVGELNEPIALNGLYSSTRAHNVSEDMLAPLNEFISQSIYQGDHYQFASYDENQKILTYMQTTENNLPLVDGSGEIAFHLNDDYQVYMFDQTFAGDCKPQGTKRKIVSEKQALESLYLNNKIQKGDTVVRSLLGYYQTLKVDDMIVYNPVWVFFIQNNDGSFERLHVDGINGTIVQADSN